MADTAFFSPPFAGRRSLALGSHLILRQAADVVQYAEVAESSVLVPTPHPSVRALFDRQSLMGQTCSERGNLRVIRVNLRGGIEMATGLIGLLCY